MVDLPRTADTPLVRTDFSDDAAWLRLIETVATPSIDGFLANVQIVDDPRFAGVDQSDLTASSARHALAIVADRQAMNDPTHPLCCVELESGKSLRVVASALWSIENNISLGNMDFDEFVEAAHADGIFREFP
jgi:hypothetical protein